MTKRSKQSLTAKAIRKLVFSKFPYMLGHSCGKPALYMSREPEEGIRMLRTELIYPDGSMPQGDGPECFSCKKPLMHDDFDNVNVVKLQ